MPKPEEVLPCTCPYIDGFRIKRTTCPRHSPTDTYPAGTKRPASRTDYGSTVEGRDVTEPLAPVAVHERGSAPRDDQSPGDDTRATPNGPSVRQPSLLAQCPACNSVMKPTRLNNCKDEWHEH